MTLIHDHAAMIDACCHDDDDDGDANDDDCCCLHRRYYLRRRRHHHRLWCWPISLIWDWTVCCQTANAAVFLAMVHYVCYVANQVFVPDHHHFLRCHDDYYNCSDYAAYYLYYIVAVIADDRD